MTQRDSNSYVHVTECEFDVNFVATEHVFPHTYQAENSNAVLTSDSHKYIYGGSVYPTNDTNAIGIVYETVDMTNFETKAISVIDSNAVIYKNRLYEALDSAAKTALEARGFVFVDAPDYRERWFEEV